MRPLNIGIAPNAFKHSLTARQAAQAIQAGLAASRLKCQTQLMPLADGGDGTLEVMLSQAGSQRRTITVENALGEPIQADYGVLSDGSTAVIEMALASGLAQLGGRRDALHASTYGTGQLMHHALENGAKRIILGVGGSATTDGGAGCLQALGVGLFATSGDLLERGGIALKQFFHLASNLPPADILILCDVDNPPIGERGAARIFAPQKGATPEQVELLDRNLTHFFTILAQSGYPDVRTLAGGGAAGGIAGGLAAVMGAKLVSGAKTIFDVLGYADLLAQCDLVITGEGGLDSQTVGGKAPWMIATEAQKLGIPTIVLAGSIPPTLESWQTMPFGAGFSLIPLPTDLDTAIKHTADWLSQTAYQVGNLLAISQEIFTGISKNSP